jgi:hypothetical protein
LDLKSVLGLPCDNDTVWMETYRSIAKRLDTNNHSNKNKNGNGNSIAGTDFVMESVNQVNCSDRSLISAIQGRIKAIVGPRHFLIFCRAKKMKAHLSSF